MSDKLQVPLRKCGREDSIYQAGIAKDEECKEARDECLRASLVEKYIWVSMRGSRCALDFDSIRLNWIKV